MKRRAFFIATTLTAAAAGCLGSGDSDDENSSGNNTSSNGEESDPVEEPDPAEAAFSVRPETPEAGEEVTLDASGSTGAIESYDWNLPEGTASGETTTVTFEQAGDYEVELTVTAGESESTTRRTVTVPLTASFAVTSQQLETGETVLMEATASPNVVESYEWNLPDGTATGKRVTRAFEQPGEYDLQLTVTGRDGESATTTRTVTVERPLTASFEVTPLRPTPEQEVTLDASDSVGSIQSYEWDLPGGTDSGETIDTSFPDPGDLTVGLTVTDTAGNTANRSRQIIVVDGDIDAAEARLAEVATRLDVLVAGIDGIPEPPADRIAKVRELLDSARTQLESVEGTQGESERISTLQSVADLQTQLLDDYERSATFAATLRDGLESLPGTDEISSVESALFGEAAGAFETAKGTVPDITAGRTDVQTAKNQLEGASLPESLDYDDDLSRYVAYSQSQLPVLRRFAERLQQFSTLFVNLLEGRVEFSAQNWQQAREQFSTAAETRQAIVDSELDGVEQITDVAPVPNASELIQSLSGAAQRLEQPLELHTDAATTAVAGDTEQARDTFEEATSQLNSTVVAGDTEQARDAFEEATSQLNSTV